jgi:NAD-dependent dihydropyrimidine dehydrogenase PreA subunit
MFGVQFYVNGVTLAGIGRSFWNLILITTVVGVVLGFIYAPRTWCTFCPMGTLSAWAAPKVPKDGFPRICVEPACQMKCKRCAKVCPMQLTPYEARGKEEGYLNPDCLKCGKCVLACPTKVMKVKR